MEHGSLLGVHQGQSCPKFVSGVHPGEAGHGWGRVRGRKMQSNGLHSCSVDQRQQADSEVHICCNSALYGSKSSGILKIRGFGNEYYCVIGEQKVVPIGMESPLEVNHSPHAPRLCIEEDEM